MKKYYVLNEVGEAPVGVFSREEVMALCLKDNVNYMEGAREASPEEIEKSGREN